MVGRFHEMLLLFAKYSRSLGRWEDTVQKTFRRTIFKSPVMQSTSQGSTNLEGQFYHEYSLDMHWLREESGKERLWLQTLRTGKISRARNPCSKAQGKRSIDLPQRGAYFIFQ